MKIKPEKKKFRLERESNPDPAITGAVLSPVSFFVFLVTSKLYRPTGRSVTHEFVLYPIPDSRSSLNFFSGLIFTTA